jgi:hypothetical protein
LEESVGIKNKLAKIEIESTAIERKLDKFRRSYMKHVAYPEGPEALTQANGRHEHKAPISPA